MTWSFFIACHQASIPLKPCRRPLTMATWGQGRRRRHRQDHHRSVSPLGIAQLTSTGLCRRLFLAQGSMPRCHVSRRFRRLRRCCSRENHRRLLRNLPRRHWQPRLLSVDHVNNQSRLQMRLARPHPGWEDRLKPQQLFRPKKSLANFFVTRAQFLRLRA